METAHIGDHTPVDGRHGGEVVEKATRSEIVGASSAPVGNPLSIFDELETRLEPANVEQVDQIGDQIQNDEETGARLEFVGKHRPKEDENRIVEEGRRQHGQPANVSAALWLEGVEPKPAGGPETTPKRDDR